LIAQAELFGFTTGNLVIDAISGDPADVPQGTGAGAVGVKKKQGPGFAGRDLKVEAVDVVAIDRFRTDRERDVAETAIGDLGDEGGGYLGRLPEVEHGTVALVDEPVETGGGWGTATGELEVDGNKPGEPRPDARRWRGIGGWDRRRRQVELVDVGRGAVAPGVRLGGGRAGG